MSERRSRPKSRRGARPLPAQGEGDSWPRAKASLPAAAALALALGLQSAAADPAALFAAAAKGDARRIAAELSQGTPVDPRNQRGETPLLVATHANHVEAAEVLIQAGADVNAKDKIEDSPYLYAGARGHLEILALTLTHGADLASLNRFGGTALIPAAERGHVEAVRMLIGAGVDVNHVNRLGWTALMEAVILGDGGPAHVEIVGLLLAAGARDIPDFDGISALSHAQRLGFAQMVELLSAAQR